MHHGKLLETLLDCLLWKARIMMGFSLAPDLVKCVLIALFGEKFNIV
jgi:hypothetical protein